jgi:hypothetical protein
MGSAVAIPVLSYQALRWAAQAIVDGVLRPRCLACGENSRRNRVAVRSVLVFHDFLWPAVLFHLRVFLALITGGPCGVISPAADQAGGIA